MGRLIDEDELLKQLELYLKGSLYRHYDSDFGKTVFLTEEEAIAALKESEGD